MPELVKAATPSFYKPASKPGTPSHTFDLKKSWPWVVGFVLFGAGVILFLRSRGSSATQGPVLSVYPTEAADSSQIDNLVQTVHNLGGIGAGGGTPVTSGSVDRSAGNGGDATVTLPTYSGAARPTQPSSTGAIANWMPTGNNSNGLPVYESPQLPGFPVAASSPTSLPEVYVSPTGLPNTKLSPNGETLYLTKVGAVGGTQAYTYSTTKPAFT